MNVYRVFLVESEEHMGQRDYTVDCKTFEEADEYFRQVNDKLVAEFEARGRTVPPRYTKAIKIEEVTI